MLDGSTAVSSTLQVPPRLACHSPRWAVTVGRIEASPTTATVTRTPLNGSEAGLAVLLGEPQPAGPVRTAPSPTHTAARLIPKARLVLKGRLL